MKACIHLVAQIPYATDASVSFEGMDMWCQVTEIWEMGAGDEEEHAMLVFNYIYYLLTQKKGKESKNDIFLCIGTAIPEGQTVYVLLHESAVVEGGVSRTNNDLVVGTGADGKVIGRASAREWLLINAVNGHVFSAADLNCPLKEIACLVSPDNIYSNIQRDARPAKTLFDIKDTSNWRPFFGEKFPAPQNGISTLQRQVQYTASLPSYALEVERSISMAVKDALRKLRSQRRRSSMTTIHPQASQVVKELLSAMDNFMLNKDSILSNMTSSASSLGRTNSGTRERSNSDRDDRGRSRVADKLIINKFQQLANERMQDILIRRELNGFPINVPFTDVDEIVSIVTSLSVHEASSPDVQFVFAVRAFPYCNSLVSLWIFIGTLETTMD